MLTGCHPFDPKGNRTKDQIFEAICYTPVEFIQPIWNNIPSDIKYIILRLLDKDPNTRMTAKELNLCIKKLLKK
jgi:serine/threonine protein kinase